MINASEQIRACRKFRGLTQKQLSQKSGVPKRTISNLELNLSRPNLTTFEALLNAMDFELTITVRTDQ